MLIRFVPAKQTPPRTGAYGLDGVVLQPGLNDLPLRLALKLSRHPDYEALVVAGILELVEEPDQGTGSSEEPVPSEEPTDLINVNTCWASALMALPHIGEVTAKRILDGRPYESLEEAQVASQLSASKWAEIEPRFTLGED